MEGYIDQSYYTPVTEKHASYDNGITRLTSRITRSARSRTETNTKTETTLALHTRHAFPLRQWPIMV